MDRFFELKVFVQIVESGSLSAAAERLDVAKSVVSRALKALETRLGAQLMVRTTRRQHLTEVGNDFYERALGVLAEMEAADESVAAADSALRGRLRIAAPQAYGISHLTASVLEFMQRYPDVVIDLDLSDRLVDIAREGFDMAIRISTLEDSTLRARRLGPIRIRACASPAYLQGTGVPRIPQDLERHQCIRYSQVRTPHTWHYLDPDGKQGQVNVPVRAFSSSGDFMREAAIAGAGIVLMPDFLVDKALAAGTLVSFLDDYQWYESAPVQHVYMVFPPTRHRARRVRVFADFLAARLRA